MERLEVAHAEFTRRSQALVVRGFLPLFPSKNFLCDQEEKWSGQIPTLELTRVLVSMSVFTVHCGLDCASFWPGLRLAASGSHYVFPSGTGRTKDVVQGHPHLPCAAFNMSSWWRAPSGPGKMVPLPSRAVVPSLLFLEESLCHLKKNTLKVKVNPSSYGWLSLCLC